MPELAQTLQNSEVAQPQQACLELDELWSYVGNKKNKVWTWIALERSTRQIVGYAVGDRSANTAEALWQSIPESYRQRTCYTDFWEAYNQVIPAELHKPVGKQTGQTAHIERWNNTLRQHLSRFVRKTLSFSKSMLMHEVSLKIFLHRYNKELLPLSSSLFNAT